MGDGPFIRQAHEKVGIVKIPRVKLVTGASGVDDGDVSSTNPLPVAMGSAAQSIRIDDTGTYQYFGYAPLASLEGDAVWKISRLTSANPQALLWADGNADYDNVWTNRASLSYS